MNLDIKQYEWQQNDSLGDYLISTASKHLDHDFINTAFDTEDMYWARPLSPAQLTSLISHSRVFGIYEMLPTSKPAKSADSPDSPRTPSPTLDAESGSSPKQIGLARFITDHVTFVYICDVYISPAYRGRGLAKWLLKCFDQVLKDMPMLTTTLLLTSPGKTQEFYSSEMDFSDMKEKYPEKVVMARDIIAKDHR